MIAAKELINRIDGLPRQPIDLTGGVNPDGSPRPIYINSGQGFLPATVTVHASPATDNAADVTTLQGGNMAQTGTKDVHSDNRDAKAGTPA